MSELKFCPFCGGRQTYRKHDGGVWLTTTNHKRGCIMRDALAFVAFDTEAEAIAAWNSRAERVCQNVDDHKTVWFICSVCGYPQKLSYTRSYCPQCGAKVVD